MYIFLVEEHCLAWPPIRQHLTMVVNHGNPDTLIQLPGERVTEGPHELGVVVQTKILAENILGDLHSVVPHLTTPRLAATPATWVQ